MKKVIVGLMVLGMFSGLMADCHNVTVTDENGIIHLILVCD